MSLLDEWKGGFTLRFNSHPICDEEWLLDDRYSTETELHFIGYDANLYPLPDLSTANKHHRRATLENASIRLAKVHVEVWLDDIKLKGAGEDANINQ